MFDVFCTPENSRSPTAVECRIVAGPGPMLIAYGARLRSTRFRPWSTQNCRSTQRRLDGSFQGTPAIRSSQIDRHVVGQAGRSRRRDNGHSAMTARTNRTGAIDKGCAMPAQSRMPVSAPVSQRAGVAQASTEET
jgi:hypothetical protein